MKNNRPKPRILRRIPARPGAAQESFEIMEQHPVEHGALRMTGTVHSCHRGDHSSRNGPTSWICRLSPNKQEEREPSKRNQAEKTSTGVDSQNIFQIILISDER